MASNYKIMEGTRKNSKLYVFASKLYLADRPKGKGKGSGSGSGSFIYVRCKDYKVGDGCSARGYIENNKFVVTIPEHTCGINQEYIRQLQLKSVLKNEAEKGEKSFKAIYDEKTKQAGISIPLPEVLSAMKKRRAIDLPPNVTKPEDVVTFMEKGHPRWSRHHYKNVVHTTRTKKGKFYKPNIVFGF
jgi:hypothetical protein